ncbi:GbsR/MarR family transcriptional regulator [Chryseobacterium sp. A301]
MRSRIAIDPSLFEDFVSFYGEFFHLPPLAAKIQAFLIFDFDRQGVTFEELVEAFSASKSSISTNLHLLLEIGLIKEIPKESRKRFFSINNEFIRLRFEELLERLKSERSLFERLMVFRGTQGEYSKEKYEIYSNLIENSIANIENSLRQLYNE